LVRQLMGDGVLHRASFAQRGASALRPNPYEAPSCQETHCS
jgi:hypothetical protein